MPDRRRTAIVEYFILSLAACVILIFPPKYNWDIVGYSAIAHSYFERDPEKIHAAVYSELREALPEHRYRKLTTGEPFRAEIYRNSGYLMNQFPFYSVKPLYPLLMAALYAAGVGMVQAAIVISKLAGVAAMILTHLWASARTSRPASAALCLVVFCSPPVLRFADFLTPDPLFCVVFLAYLFAVMSPKWRGIAPFLVPPLLLARPDGVLLVVLVTGYLWWSGERRLIFPAACGLAVLQYLLQSHLSGNYGLRVLFYHSFIHTSPEPQNLDPDLALSDYARVYAENLLSADTLTLLAWVLVSGIAALGCAAIRDRRDHAAALVFLNIAYALIHWAIFPRENTRILMPSYLFFALVMALPAVEALRRRFARGWSGSRPH